MSRSTIGRYSILSTCSAGSQGIVYRAVHPTLDADLAIKVAHFNAADIRSLKLEARTLCDLKHPNICRMRDFEVIEKESKDEARSEAETILVLDYVRGQTLAERTRHHRPEQDQAIEWLKSIAAAIDYAHRNGVSHLDLNPRNVMINDQNVPIIIDFGAAMMRRARGADSETSSVSGTPGFSSPEQARGDGDVGPPSDVYSLGCLIFFLFTGKVPIQGDSEASVIQRTVDSDIDWTPLQSDDVPSEIEQLCRWAMAPKPGDRPATASIVAEKLNEYDLSRIRKPFLNWSSPAVLIVCGCGLLVGVFAFQDWRSLSSSPPTMVAQPTPVAAVQVTPMEVTHIGTYQGKALFQEELFTDRTPWLNDRILIQKRFGTPKHCLLVALNPDGNVVPCFPERANESSEAIDKLKFPPVGGSFALNDAVGAQGFLLFTSDSPLKPFDQWDDFFSELKWENEKVDGAWVFRENEMQPNSFGRVKGAILPRIRPEPFSTRLIDLQNKNELELEAVFFPVNEPPRQ